MARDPRAEPETVWEALESFATNDVTGTTPIAVARGTRVRGGPNSLPHRFPTYFIEDGSLPSEIHAARQKAGLGLVGERV